MADLIAGEHGKFAAEVGAVQGVEQVADAERVHFGGTTPGSYVITVTGASGSITQMGTVPLAVQ